MSNSEIALPVSDKSSRVVAVLDVDSEDFGSFDEDDGINVAVMTRMGVFESYSNDCKYLGKTDFLRLFFERLVPARLIVCSLQMALASLVLIDFYARLIMYICHLGTMVIW